MRQLDHHGEEFIARWEGVILYVYDDKARLHHGQPPEWDGGPVRGTLTIGIGHTDAAAHPLKCTHGLRITREQAYEILAADTAAVARHINQMVKVPLTQGQFNALMSLTYNFGEGNLKKSSLLAKLNRGDYVGARACFDLYTRSKGEHMDGLQRRRDAEQLLWDERTPVAPAEGTFIDTPKVDQPQPPKSMAKSKMGNSDIVKGAIAATTVGGTVAKQATDADPSALDHVKDMIEKGSDLASTAGTAIDTAQAVIPWWKPVLAFVTSEPILLLGAAVIIGLCVYTWIERRRHLREDLV